MDARATEFDNSLPERTGRASERSPVLLVPYTWIGDFVRCHTVVRLINARWPERPVDLVASPLTAPLAAYLPGVRQAIVADIPHRRLAVGEQIALARRLRRERYGAALVMSRKWKAALAPFLAGIPERVGHLGEARFLLLNDVRHGERSLPRMVEQCAALALPKDAPLPNILPAPQLKVPAAEVEAWRVRRGLAAERRAVALAPGAVGPSKRWPAARYGELAAALVRQGFAVWVVGGPAEASLAAEIAAAVPAGVRDLTGHDLREAVLALRAAELAVSNDSGLMHVAAALGTPTIGIFGPTSAWHWAPLNPLAAAVAAHTPPPCRPCHKPVCALGHHRCMQDIPAAQVLEAAAAALAPARATV
jgi:heptosyltransferase-2